MLTVVSQNYNLLKFTGSSVKPSSKPHVVQVLGAEQRVTINLSFSQHFYTGVARKSRSVVAFPDILRHLTAHGIEGELSFDNFMLEDDIELADLIVNLHYSVVIISLDKIVARPHQTPTMQVTLEQVHDIINTMDGTQTAWQITSLHEIESNSYSYTASWKSYHVTLSNSDWSYLLLVSPLSHPQPAYTTPPSPITLPVLSILLTKILDTTTVPVPRPVAHDVKGNWPFGWLLLRIPGPAQTHPPTSLASVREKLSDGQRACIERKLGTYLRALHEITNDSFGVPVDKPTPEPLTVPLFTALFAASQTSEDSEGNGEDMTPYSWQDTFVLQLEELLEYVCGDAEAGKTVSSDRIDINVDELRRSLTRAIGSFLFDDVDTPRLIWMTGNEEDVIMFLPSETDGKQASDVATFEGDSEADIAYILPTFGRAVWGDPLMEAWFLPPGPTTAINGGYFDGEEDDRLVVLPRHKTKRLWYTAYLALIVLAGEMSRGEGETTQKARRETIQWARSILPECVENLKNAPCY